MAGRNSRNKGKATSLFPESKKVTTTRKGRRENRGKSAAASAADTDILPVTRNKTASTPVKPVNRQTLLKQAHASSGQGGPRRKLKSQQQRMLEGQTKDLQGTGKGKSKSAAPASPKAPAAPNKAKKAAPKAKSKGKSSGSSVKLLSPSEAAKVRKQRMSDAVAAGRKKRAASGSPPKAMKGKQIRTAAMPRKKKKKSRTSLEEFMS